MAHLGHAAKPCKVVETTQEDRLLETLKRAETPEIKNIALQCLEKLAVEGSMIAIKNLGAIYYHGNFGVAVNQQKAVAFWEQAMCVREPSSTYNLAICYLKGTGVVENKERGISLLKFAASHCRYPKATLRLAEFHHYGQEGMTRDLATALYLYYCAAKLTSSLDPRGEVTAQAKTNFALALDTLRTDLKVGSHEDRIAFITEGMNYTAPLTLQDFQAAARGDLRSLGIAEGIFLEDVDLIMAEARTRMHASVLTDGAAEVSSSAAPKFIDLGLTARGGRSRPEEQAPSTYMGGGGAISGVFNFKAKTGTVEVAEPLGVNPRA